MQTAVPYILASTHCLNLTSECSVCRRKHSRLVCRVCQTSPFCYGNVYCCTWSSLEIPKILVRSCWESSVSGIMGVILNEDGSSMFLKTANALELFDEEWEIIRIFGGTLLRITMVLWKSWKTYLTENNSVTVLLGVKFISYLCSSMFIFKSNAHGRALIILLFSSTPHWKRSVLIPWKTKWSFVTLQAGGKSTFSTEKPWRTQKRKSCHYFPPSCEFDNLNWQQNMTLDTLECIAHGLFVWCSCTITDIRIAVISVAQTYAVLS